MTGDPKMAEDEDVVPSLTPLPSKAQGTRLDAGSTLMPTALTPQHLDIPQSAKTWYYLSVVAARFSRSLTASARLSGDITF